MNAKITEVFRILRGLLSADIIAGVTGAYHDVSGARRIAAQLQTGTVAAASTVTLQLMQAQDDAGTGAKALGDPVTVAAGVGGEALDLSVDAKVEDLDTNNGYTHVAVQADSDNATAVQASAVLILGNNRFNP